MHGVRVVKSQRDLVVDVLCQIFFSLLFAYFFRCHYIDLQFPRNWLVASSMSILPECALGKQKKSYLTKNI